MTHGKNRIIEGIVDASPAQSGVTLIELLITVVIIGILTAVAMPSYRNHVAQVNRAEVKGILLENAQFLERNYASNNCYHRTDASCTTTTANVTLPYTQSPKTGTAKYNITVVYNADSGGAACTNATSTPAFGQCFILSAAPTGNMTGDQCGTYTLDQAGRQGPAGSVESCWQR